MSRYPEFDLSQIRMHEAESCGSVIEVGRFGVTPKVGASFAEFFDGLPNIFAGADVKLVANKIAKARETGRAVVLCIGAHVVKCGLSPVLIGLMERGLVSAVAMNGAVAIHDVEIALFGKTSEDVEQGLLHGTFGLAEQPSAFINGELSRAQREELGAGEALGIALTEQGAPFSNYSLLACAHRLNLPATVHIAIGTDITHMQFGANGAAHGETSLRDFRILTAAMRTLANGGVLLNVGSAVIMPEVVLKAIALLRNQSRDFTGFLGVDLDFIRNHRSYQQVVQRVAAIGGEGISLTGHHEILLPLLAYAVLEASAGLK